MDTMKEFYPNQISYNSYSKKTTGSKYFRSDFQ